MYSIDQWFEDGCPYQEGVELYAELGTNKALKTMLGFGENKFNGRKLYAALEELQQTTNLKQDQEQEIAQEQKEEAAARDPRLTKLYQERHMIHAQLSCTPSEADRKRQAFKILGITDKVERIMGVQDEEPTKDHTLPTSPVKLMRKLTNNRSYISKQKNHTNSPGEVQRRIDENIEIDKLLGGE